MDDAATVFFGYETTYLFSNKRVTGVKMYPAVLFADLLYQFSLK